MRVGSVFKCVQSTEFAFTMYQTSFLIAAISAIVFGYYRDDWISSQANYQTTLIIWGCSNIILQLCFLSGLLATIIIEKKT